MANKRRFLAKASSAAILIGLTYPVHAQSTGPVGTPSTNEQATSESRPVASPKPDDEPQAPRDAEDIVVTGSRIQRADYVAESPIVSIGQNTIQNNGTPALDQALDTLPQFTGSATGQSPTATTGQARSAGRATANLRGLGAPRTLVLLDGRRLQPSDPFNVVDLNVLPSSLIQTVEVITGGASAVYGSDAIAGVVNFKLDSRFRGLRLDADNLVAAAGDGRTTTVSAVAGTRFADDRGNAVLSVQYLDRAEIFRSERRFFDNVNGASQGAAGLISPTGTNLVSNAALTALFRGKYGLSAQPTNGANLSLNPDGSVYGNIGAINFKNQPQYFYNAAANSVQFVRDLTLQAPLRRISTFGRVSYKLSDSIEAYAQGFYTHYKTDQNTVGVNVSETATTVPVTNPYITPDLAALLASRPNPTARFQYSYNTARISPLRFTQTNDVYQLLGGFKGKLGLGDFSYDIYASHGETRQVQTSIGYVNRQAFTNVVNAADGGNSLCAGGYSLFDLTPVSAACKAYLGRATSGLEKVGQTEASANLEGALLTLPAGDVRVAAGLDYRRNSFTSLPDAQFTNDELQGGIIVRPGQGTQNVVDAFGEVFVPLLEELPLIRKLSIDVAYRYSHYDTSGGVSSYKASTEWELARPLAIRAGYQRAIRAPSVGELFGASRNGSSVIGTPQQGGGDPCDIRSVYRTGANAAQARTLCIAQGVPVGLVDTLQVSGTAAGTQLTGNPNVSPEIADTFTVGGIFRSPVGGLFSEFTTSVDFYKIKIRNAIGTVPASVSLQTCFNGTGQNPTYSNDNAFCRNIVRNGAFINYVVEASANLARYETSGIDVETDWRIRADMLGLNPDFGALALNAVVSYVDSYKIQTTPTGALLDYVGTIGNNTIDTESLSHPKWRVTASGTYSVGPLSLGVRYRSIGKMANSVNVGSALTASGVAAVHYFDLNGRIAVRDGFEFRFGVVNLGDTQPPVFTGQAATDPSTYDLVGRRFFAGVTAKF